MRKSKLGLSAKTDGYEISFAVGTKCGSECQQKRFIILESDNLKHAVCVFTRYLL